MGLRLPPELERKVLELAGDTGRTPAPAADVSEKEFQADVFKLAKRLGWLVYHTYDSRKSVGGFPDLVLLRERLIVVELKVKGRKPKPDQVEWLEAFRRAGVTAVVWEPADWPAIEAVLRGGSGA